MPAEPTQPAPSSRIDVRTLSLAQLQKLAAGGSRRARAELEGRMRAAPPPVAPPARPVQPSAAAAPVRAAVTRPPTAFEPLATSSSARRPPANPPTLTERATLHDHAHLGERADQRQHPVAAAAQLARQTAALPSGTGGADPRPLDEALQARLALIAQQEDAASRASGPPRLLGMVLIAWGALLVLGGLVTLAHGGGAYYLFCGLGSAGVGWLLMRCSRWAIVAHGALLLVALAWAWFGQKAPSVAMVLVQAAPVWIAALWMVVRPVREGLE